MEQIIVAPGGPAGPTENNMSSMEAKETPAIGSITSAQVKWFDPLRGFGFLTRGPNTEDIFVHQRDLQDNTRSLTAGDTVQFKYTIENGKPKAKEVTNPNIPSKSSNDHASLTNPQFAARLAANPEIKLGRVKWWDMKKGYGFITPLDGGQDVFVHQSEVKSTAFRALHEGSDVEYRASLEYNDGKEQLKAKEVTAPGGAAIVPPNNNETTIALNQMATLSAMGMIPLLPTQFATALGRKTGTVKWYDEKKGYGFVITADGQQYFCHSSTITAMPGSEPTVQQGQIVEFSSELKDGKHRTVNVTLPGGTPITDGGLGGLGKRKGWGQFGLDSAGKHPRMDTGSFGFAGYTGADLAQQQLLQQQLLLQQQQLQQQHQGYYGADQYGGGSTGTNSTTGYGSTSSTQANTIFPGNTNYSYPQYGNNFYHAQ